MKKPFLLSAAVLFLALTGCGPMVIGTTTAMALDQERVNLLSNSYAVADVLSERTSDHISKSTPLSVQNLDQIIHHGRKNVFGEPMDVKESPELGRVLAEQMRQRFVQLGHNVVDANPWATRHHGAEVSGTYEIVDGRMNVVLQMRDLATARILTVYEYSLPVTYDIKKVMHPNRQAIPPLVSPAE